MSITQKYYNKIKIDRLKNGQFSYLHTPFGTEKPHFGTKKQIWNSKNIDVNMCFTVN